MGTNMEALSILRNALAISPSLGKCAPCAGHVVIGETGNWNRINIDLNSASKAVGSSFTNGRQLARVIAASLNAGPALLARIDQLERQVDELRAVTSAALQAGGALLHADGARRQAASAREVPAGGEPFAETSELDARAPGLGAA